MLNAKAIIERISNAAIKPDENGTEVMVDVKNDILELRAQAMTDVKMCDMLLQMAVDNERLKMALVCTEDQLREAVTYDANKAMAAANRNELHQKVEEKRLQAERGKND